MKFISFIPFSTNPGICIYPNFFAQKRRAYESKNKILLVEAKTGGNKSFNIRQLYYPYKSIYDVIPFEENEENKFIG